MRMSDERLAEIFAEMPRNPEMNLTPELLQALKAERAEVERLRASNQFWEDEATCLRDDLEAAESRLAGLVGALENLFEGWWDSSAPITVIPDGRWSQMLRAAIAKATGEQT